MNNATPSATKVEKVAQIINTKQPNTTQGPTVNPKTAPIATTSPNKMEGDMKKQENVANTPNAVAECDKIVNESEDLIDALESVAKLYNIPEENIVCDDTLDTIKVQGDTIVAPSVSAQGKTASIMKSIAAVLDYISQRIDNKVNDFQYGNIERGIIQDHIKNDANPAKGKVIARHIDPNGDEVLVYDSGLVDMANTYTAQQFVNELREAGAIPEIKTTDSVNPVKSDFSYWTAEDDITAGVVDTTTQTGGSDYGASANNPEGPVSTPNNTNMTASYDNNASDGKIANYDGTEQVDLVQKLNESAVMLDLVSKYGDTRHLGYDLLTEQGFNFIKPIDFISETASEGGKKKKTISPTDIKHMKFDNKHIMNAIKYMNECRAEQDYATGKHFDLQRMVNNPKWNKAIKELEEQFDCHLVVRFIKEDNIPESGGGFTQYFSNEAKAKCHISKTKGFQLNGLPIDIYFLNSFLTTYCPTDQKLFGQFVIGVFLHEIFHNISAVLRLYNAEFKTMVSSTMLMASMSKSAKVRRKLITNFVETANKIGFINKNLIERKAYIKQLLFLCSADKQIKSLKDAKKLVEEGDSEKLDAYIAAAEKIVKQRERELKGTGMAVFYILAGAIHGGCIGFALSTGDIPLAAFMLAMGLISFTTASLEIATRREERRLVEDRKSGKTKTTEEHWADMFAAMYSLPVALFPHAPSRMTAASMSDDQIKRLHQIELAQVNLFGDVHPPTMERMYASCKAAEQLLNSGVKLNADVKKYLEWVVENYKRIDEVEDINTNYSKHTFDPKTAENLDLHIQNLINKSGVTLTEQAILFLFGPDETVI